MGERCQDKGTLADYAICEPWIAQVHVPAFYAMPELLN